MRTARTRISKPPRSSGVVFLATRTRDSPDRKATMSPALREHVLLLGAMGSGKTTVGRLLATSLGRPFVDSDLELHKRGLDAKALLVASGRDALHDVESEVVQQAVASPVPAVIAAAASVIDDDATRKV